MRVGRLKLQAYAINRRRASHLCYISCSSSLDRFLHKLALSRIKLLAPHLGQTNWAASVPCESEFVIALLALIIS